MGWIQFLVGELNLAGWVDHGAPLYTLGLYANSSATYTSINDKLKENLDIALWFGPEEFLNVSMVRYDGVTLPVVKFIEAGINLTSDTDIVTFKITRDDYELPYKSIQMDYKKNYSVLSNSGMATVLSEAVKAPYKIEFKTLKQDNICIPDPYLLDNSIEYETSLQEDTDAQIEIDGWVEKREFITDYLTVTCPILSYNVNVILGAIIGKNGDFINISVTDTLISSTAYLISNNNPFYSDQEMLRLGDVVEVVNLNFDYSNHIFIVYASSVNTRTMFVEYKLFGVREVSRCV